MKMKVRFQSLQENLRANIWSRLERGEVTGKGLARDAGFQQAHLSNFLNRRRGLGLQAMDRLLDLLHIDVLHLAGVSNVERRESNSAEDDTQLVALVSLDAAARVIRFTADDIQGAVSFPRTFLLRLKPKTDGNRRDWTRFAAATLDARSIEGMAPLLKPEAVVLIDRHYNAAPLQPADQALYAVIDGGRCVVRRLTLAPGALILRPQTESPSSPLHVLPIPIGKRAGNFIVGRIRHIAMEV
jgi:hypothetical protein